MEEKDIQKIKQEIIEKNYNKNVEEKDIEYVEELQLLEANDTNYGLSENDVFIIKIEQGEDENKTIIYELYDKEGKLIGKTDLEGNLELTEDYKNMLQEKYKEFYNRLNLDKRKIKTENIEKQLEEKDVGAAISRLNEENIEETKKLEDLEQQKDDIEKPEKLQQNEQVEKIEKSLGLDSKDIKSSSEIKDLEFYRIVPEAKEYNGNVSIVYVGSTNEFMIVGQDRKTGEYMPLKTVEASRATTVGEAKKTMDLGNDGKEIKEESLKAIINIKGEKEYSFSAKLEGINPIEFKELRRDLTTGKYISADLQTTHQYPTNIEIRDMMNGDKNRNVRDEVAEYDKRDKAGDEEITIDEIKDKTQEQEEEQREKDEDEGRGERTNPDFDPEAHRPPVQY